jgi:carbon-monoxide dehydrogenase iron sulfur subunit
MRIVVDVDSCTGCRECETACSEHHYGVDDREKSAIRVDEDPKRPGVFIPKVCDQCGDCSKICSTECITLQEGDRYILDSEECMYCTMCIEECTKHLMFEHKDFESPFKCDLCLKCVEACDADALTTAE